MTQTIRNGKVTPWVYDTVKETPIPSISSVSVTALGLTGETLKGPAFEIVNVGNWTEYKQYFGGTSTEKFKSNNFPKYELPYVAQEYLKESDNLYVVRVLGLSGYDAGRAWGITMKGEITENKESLVAVLRSKGVLNEATQTVESSISNTQTIYTSAITLENDISFKILTANVTLNENILGLSEDDSTFYIIGNKDKGSFGVYIDLSTISTLPMTEFDCNFSKAIFNDGELTLPMNNTELSVYNVSGDYTSVTIKPTENIVLSGVTIDDSGNIETTTSAINFVANITFFDKNGVTTELRKVSLDNTSPNFILNVFGAKINDVEGSPIWVDEYYLDGFNFNELLESDVEFNIVELPKYEVNNYKSSYKPARTPWIVSEVIGGQIKNLFRAISISDGEASNNEIKITIENVDKTTKTFDLIIRSFGDRDDSVVVLESYRNLNLIKDDKNYICKRIGDAEGEYNINSKYVVIEIAEGNLQNEIPSGFKGYPIRKHLNYTYPSPLYSVGYNSDIKIKKQTLGIPSLQTPTFDVDYLKYKGINNNTNSDYGTYSDELTSGFHIQTEASSLGYTTNDTNVFVDENGDEITDKSIIKQMFKFTVLLHSGFDGWDIYQENRGLSSNYKYNKTYAKIGLNNGKYTEYSDNDFPENFKALTSDYYAYYKGIRAFSNPKTVAINLIATPGIDIINQTSLTDEVIDMIENERFDALYLVNTPDTTNNSVSTLITPKELSQLVNDLGIDTTFATTFYPWVQYPDIENDGKYVWLSPIKDLCRSIAFTDNISYPWFAPVGFGRGNVNAVRARTRLKNADTEYLQNSNINYVETFSSTGEGLKLWGQRLLRKNADDFVVSRIGVLRLMLYLRSIIRNVVKKDIFEQNDSEVVGLIRSQITPILESVAGQRGIEREYRLDVTQTPEDKDLRQIRISIWLKPIGALEFIEITFNVTPNQVSFA
jgi:hypothetical protein